MGSDERIQGLSWLKPVSLLKTFVAGRGYLLWPEDLALAGNMQLMETSLFVPDASTSRITYSITKLSPNSSLLAFKLHWAQHACAAEPADLYFWHAIVCNTPQSESSALALSDLGISLLNYYELHYAEVGEALAQIATTPNAPSWGERFFRLPQQLPSSLNSPMRAMLADVRKTMPAIPAPASVHPAAPNVWQWGAISGWLVSLFLLVLVLRG